MEKGSICMLKQITIDTKPDGMPITIPARINEANFEQQVKRFIEIADYNPFDGQLHISFFRTCHGGQWTMRILEAIVQELKAPSIDLTLSQERTAILPFFTYQLERHKNLADTDFPVAGSLPKLPL
jgi:hypothetical protein